MANIDYESMSDDEILALIGEAPKGDSSKKTKPLYERTSVESMVESGMNPYAAAALATAQEAAPAGYQFLNQMTGGLATPVLEQYGISAPQAETGAGQALEALGAGAGFAVGAPMKVGGMAAKAIPGAGIIPSMLRGATQIGTAGALQTPEGGMGDIMGRTKQAAMGAAGGLAFGAAQRGLENLTRLGAKEAPKLAKQVRGQYRLFKKRLTKDFGKGLEAIAKRNPDKTVDFSKPIDNLKNTIDDSKKVKSFVNRLSDNSKKMIENPKPLSITESQSLVNDIKSTATTKQVIGDIQPNEIAINRFIKELNATRERAFKGLRQLNARYAKSMEADNLINKYMKPGKTLSIPKADDPEVKAALKVVFPQETINNLGGYGMAQNVAKFVPSVLGSAARIGILGAGLGAGLSRLKQGGD